MYCINNVHKVGYLYTEWRYSSNNNIDKYNIIIYWYNSRTSRSRNQVSQATQVGQHTPARQHRHIPKHVFSFSANAMCCQGGEKKKAQDNETKTYNNSKKSFHMFFPLYYTQLILISNFKFH